MTQFACRNMHACLGIDVDVDRARAHAIYACTLQVFLCIHSAAVCKYEQFTLHLLNIGLIIQKIRLFECCEGKLWNVMYEFQNRGGQQSLWNMRTGDTLSQLTAGEVMAWKESYEWWKN